MGRLFAALQRVGMMVIGKEEVSFKAKDAFR